MNPKFKSVGCIQSQSDPLFWHVDLVRGGIRIAKVSGVGDMEAKENADFIVTACNTQEELLAAYRELWIAVENGFENDKFFELRRRFKQVVSKFEGKN